MIPLRLSYASASERKPRPRQNDTRISPQYFISIPLPQNFNIEVSPRSNRFAAPVRTVPLAEKLSGLLRRSEHRLTCTCCRKLIQLVNREKDERELSGWRGRRGDVHQVLSFFFRSRFISRLLHQCLVINLLAVDCQCHYRSTTSTNGIDLPFIYANVKFVNIMQSIKTKKKIVSSTFSPAFLHSPVPMASTNGRFYSPCSISPSLFVVRSPFNRAAVSC